MRLHSFLPWPPAAFEPARKEEKPRKPKAVDETVAAHAVQPVPHPPQPKDDTGEDGGQGPGINIIA
jgi:hypothetical protein